MPFLNRAKQLSNDNWFVRWIDGCENRREGLEKMERAKQKEADRERELLEHAEAAKQQKLRADRQIETEDLLASTAVDIKSKFVCVFFCSFHSCFFIETVSGIECSAQTIFLRPTAVLASYSNRLLINEIL